jgi:ubiquinone/menaquinone biosynthesis C-methylase UbiE
MIKEMRSFWEKHAKEYRTAFEQLDELASYLHRTERRHLFQVVSTSPEMEVLDLGCGTGRWAFEFARRCRRVVAADFSKGMIERARQEATDRGLENIEFHVASIQEFSSTDRFDIIVLSGILVYFQDDELPEILQNVHRHLKPGGKVVSRETVAIHERQELLNQFHNKVDDTYSAIYRLPDEYRQVFARCGFRQLYADDFTPTNFPMILYRRLIPQRFKTSWLPRKLLQAALLVQYWLDPFLLRNKWTYRPIMHRFWKIKSMLFVYGID